MTGAVPIPIRTILRAGLWPGTRHSSTASRSCTMAAADPLIITWPKGIKAKGEIRNQYSFITEVMATALDATGTPFVAEIDGVKQLPIDGKSLTYSFDNAAAPSARTEQYYEQ